MKFQLSFTEKKFLNSSIEISGRFYEALKDLLNYNSDKKIMKGIVCETLEKYDKYLSWYLVKIQCTSLHEY